MEKRRNPVKRRKQNPEIGERAERVHHKTDLLFRTWLPGDRLARGEVQLDQGKYRRSGYDDLLILGV
jgi:hypothetical protein